MARDEVVAYLERYAGDLGGAQCGRVWRRGRFAGVLPGRGLSPADVVGRSWRRQRGCRHRQLRVFRTGRRRRRRCRADLLQVDVGGYRNEQALPPGPRAHRRKWPVGMPDRGGAARGRTRGIRGVRQSAVGSGRLGGRDLVWWLLETGFLTLAVRTRCRPLLRGWPRTSSLPVITEVVISTCGRCAHPVSR